MCGASNLAVVVLPTPGNPQIITTADIDYFTALDVDELEETPNEHEI